MNVECKLVAKTQSKQRAPGPRQPPPSVPGQLLASGGHLCPLDRWPPPPPPSSLPFPHSYLHPTYVASCSYLLSLWNQRLPGARIDGRPPWKSLWEKIATLASILRAPGPPACLPPPSRTAFLNRGQSHPCGQFLRDEEYKFDKIYTYHVEIGLSASIYEVHIHARRGVLGNWLRLLTARIDWNVKLRDKRWKLLLSYWCDEQFCPGKRHSQYVHKIPFLKQVLKAIFSSQIQGKQQPRSTRLVSIGKISANALIQQPRLSGCERGNSLSLNALKTAQTQPVVYRYVAWYDYKVQKYICYIERLI